MDLLLSRGGAVWGDRARLVLMNAEAPPEAHGAVNSIRQRHRSAIARGVLHVTKVPTDRHAVTSGSRDSAREVQWKKKQVLDAAALMESCVGMGTHYLHLEDDVVPAPGYLARILDFVEEEERAGGWHALTFYSASPVAHRGAVDLKRFWGFIGVLFRTSDLPALVAELRRRSDEAPVDTLLTDYLEAGGLELRAHTPSLFEHVGFHSSLPTRVQSFRAWSWAGDRTPAHRFLRLFRRSLHVRWLWWRSRRS